MVPDQYMNRSNGAGSNFSQWNPAGGGNNPAVIQPTRAGSMSQSQNTYAYQPAWGYQQSSTGGGASGASYGTDAQGQAAQSRANAFGLAQNYYDTVHSNPLDQGISQALQGRISGGNVPYTADVRNSLYSNASDQSAGAYGNQVAQLRGNPGDPAYQAKVRELDSQRQQSNQGSLQNINMNADLQNYNAVGNAINSGSGYQAAYMGRLGAASGNLQDLNTNSRFNNFSGGPGWGQYSSQFGGMSNINNGAGWGPPNYSDAPQNDVYQQPSNSPLLGGGGGMDSNRGVGGSVQTQNNRFPYTPPSTSAQYNGADGQSNTWQDPNGYSSGGQGAGMMGWQNSLPGAAGAAWQDPSMYQGSPAGAATAQTQAPLPWWKQPGAWSQPQAQSQAPYQWGDPTASPDPMPY